MTRLCSGLPHFLQSNEGRFSCEFLLENQLTLREQTTVMNLLTPHIKYLYSNKRSFRILECVIGCFNHELVSPIIKEGTKCIIENIRCREGFFLAKALICSVKFEQLQVSIVQAILKNLQLYFTFNNGSLVIKMIIKQFQETSYTYHKNASKHTELNHNNLKVVHKVNADTITTKALELLINGLCQHIENWDYKAWRAVISYGLKNSSYFNHKLCSILASNKGFLFRFLKTSTALKNLRLMINRLNTPNLIRLYICLKNVLNQLTIISPELSNSILKLLKHPNFTALTSGNCNSTKVEVATSITENFYIVNECHLTNINQVKPKCYQRSRLLNSIVIFNPTYCPGYQAMNYYCNK